MFYLIPRLSWTDTRGCQATDANIGLSLVSGGREEREGTKYLKLRRTKQNSFIMIGTKWSVELLYKEENTTELLYKEENKYPIRSPHFQNHLFSVVIFYIPKRFIEIFSVTCM